ncbi:hypothetical protein B0H13DRAFT_2291818 [Mycena leptocephala]|nr:hypothetical protein B0H13DRAFT_2291818 [Mycena leptocephala]
MSGSGATYYDEELKLLLRLLEKLRRLYPSVTPTNSLAMSRILSKTVVSHALEVSFGPRKEPGPAGARIIIAFKSRGSELEEVVPRPVQTTAAKRLLEDDQVQGQANKKRNKMLGWRSNKRRRRLKRRRKDGARRNLTDDEQPAKAAARGRGAPKSDILDQLTVSCTTKSTGKARFRCSGTGCQTSWAAPRQSGRVLSHAVDCRFLSAELKEEALEISAGNSLGAKVEAASSGASATDAFSGFRRAGADNKAKAVRSGW